MELLAALLTLAFQAMVPITLAAIGEIFSERAGVVNIGLEGLMVISAFFAVVGAKGTGDPWIGLVCGLGAGVVVGLIHGLISVYLRGDQVISGVGINLLGLGLVGSGMVALWGGPLQLPAALQVPSLPAPWGRVSPIFIVMLLLAAFTWWLLFRTALGLRVRAVGENPAPADVAGIRVERLRFGAVIYGAFLGGLAGAFFSLDWTHTITKTLPAERGFIALANVVFSKLNPLLALLGGFIFGFFDALSFWVSNVPGINRFVPWQFVRMIPYVATLLVLMGAIGRARFPQALGRPYWRE
ncbi:MAG: ABC transporter permease [Candidatus Acetothermia bacterium]|jgi:simple sugar transport system permease protein|nr:ABC transporter permease [Candidatus Acetothermia bacterium]MDH7504657.1 ABC transporter permease [Candidatus Acetothermia bacterium]